MPARWGEPERASTWWGPLRTNRERFRDYAYNLFLMLVTFLAVIGAYGMFKWAALVL